MKLTSLMLALAAAVAACGGSSPPPGKYLIGTLNGSGAMPCIRVPIASPDGNPACTVLEDLIDGGSTTSVMIPSCVESANVQPCWMLATIMQPTCTGLNLFILDGGVTVTPTPAMSYSYSCLLCSSSSPPPPGC